MSERSARAIFMGRHFTISRRRNAYKKSQGDYPNSHLSGRASHELCHRAVDRRGFYLHQHGAPVLGRRWQTRQRCGHSPAARRIRPRAKAGIQALGTGHVPRRDGVGGNCFAGLPASWAVFLARAPWSAAVGDQRDSLGHVCQGDWGFGVGGVFQEGGWVQVCKVGHVFLFAVVFGVGGGVVGGGVGVSGAVR